MREGIVLLMAGVILAAGSISTCWTADNYISANEIRAVAVSSPSGMDDGVQIKKWLNNIKPAAGVKHNPKMINDRTPYWTTTVNRSSGRRGQQ